jgi:hypothetical protein
MWLSRYMGKVHRMAVSRVRGFRNTQVDKQRMEDMLGRMKSHVPKEKSGKRV